MPIDGAGADDHARSAPCSFAPEIQYRWGMSYTANADTSGTTASTHKVLWSAFE